MPRIKAEGEGEWNARKHGGPKRRIWRKIHIGIDEETLEVRAIEVTTSNVGDAPMLLDGLVQLSVRGTARTAPPANPHDGDRFLVALGATGDWTGWDNSVAYWVDGVWMQLPPRLGWRAWVEEFDGSANGPGDHLPGERLLLVYDVAGWIGTTPATLQNMALLGLGTTANASNPFSAKLNSVLWTAKTIAEGGTGDLFYTMNKETAGDDLGLTLQTGFVTKALAGLFGSDRFRLAVSADGSTFFDGLSVDNATTGVMLALLAGIAIKLKIFGGAP